MAAPRRSNNRRRRASGTRMIQVSMRQLLTASLSGWSKRVGFTKNPIRRLKSYRRQNYRPRVWLQARTLNGRRDENIALLGRNRLNVQRRSNIRRNKRGTLYAWR
ncbi:hypothetical protein BaRGS_00014489 [Batillaria attramentaria]|uniref:Ribosomal protein L20 n=1 Tax=Batillaria attramentaria TaxID=370345 RepID=A0ABD0L474_9CAEN